LFLVDSESFILSEIKKIKLEEKLILEAEVSGDNIKNYKFNNDVKAITYNDMWIKGPSKDGGQVKKEKGKWVCQVVVDV
jgi:SHS2 domain-containing protein